jgi:hypothetical protein
MGDKKDRLLKEVAGLRQLRGGNINVLRGGRAAETSVADMLAALKAADADPAAVTFAPAAPAGGAADAAAAAPMEVDGAQPSAAAAPAAAGPQGSSGSGKKCSGGSAPSKGHLDNLTCVVWEDWRVSVDGVGEGWKKADEGVAARRGGRPGPSGRRRTRRRHLGSRPGRPVPSPHQRPPGPQAVISHQHLMPPRGLAGGTGSGSGTRNPLWEPDHLSSVCNPTWPATGAAIPPRTHVHALPGSASFGFLRFHPHDYPAAPAFRSPSGWTSC